MIKFRFTGLFVLGFTVSLMLGCTATGPIYKDFISNWQPLNKSSARVFFYKEEKKDVFGMASTAVFSVNGIQKGIVNWGGFNVIDLPPGSTKLSVSQEGGMGSCSVQINLKENSSYFFKIDQRLDQAGAVLFFGLVGSLIIDTLAGDCGGAYKIALVEESVAINQLSKLRLTK